MILPNYFNAKKSLHLFGLFNDFNFFKNLYIEKKLPKVLMLSGNKGNGKSTLLNHLMYFIFDNDNYDEKINKLKKETTFHKHFIDNSFSNIFYLSGSDFKNIKIEDIRKLKEKIFQTSFSNLPRFVIFDDVELFNNNSLNALLKIIEEPSENNFFFLINNQTKPLLETIKSRCLDVKVILSSQQKQDIIKSLTNNFDIKSLIDSNLSNLTPGNYIKFNYIFSSNQMSLNEDYLKNLQVLLNLYKKDKDVIYIDMSLFLTDNYFNKLKNKNLFSNEKIIEYKNFVFENINKFFNYNLNQKALLNNIDNKIND